MAKNLSDAETEAIYEAIAVGVKTYEQAVEVDQPRVAAFQLLISSS